MPGSYLAILKAAARHSSKIAAVSARGTVAGMTVTADDLAVRAATPSSEGIPQDLEVKFLKETAKVSIRNKAWLYPLLLGTVAIAPGLLHPLLNIGGAYLSYEGAHEAHELAHDLTHKNEPGAHVEGHDLADAKLVAADGSVMERFSETIKKAGILDIVLSAELGIIALKGMGAAEAFTQAGINFAKTGQLAAYLEPLALHGPALGLMAIGVTAGVFLPVTVLLRADNWAENLKKLEGDSVLAKTGRAIGNGIVPVVNTIMKGLPYVGTAAMLAVGGHILLENIPTAMHAIEGVAHSMGSLGFLAEYGAAIAVGLGSGAIIQKGIVPALKPVAGWLKTGFGKAKELLGLGGGKGTDLVPGPTPDLAPDALAPAILIAPEPAVKAKGPVPDMRTHLAEAVTPADIANQNVDPDIAITGPARASGFDKKL